MSLLYDYNMSQNLIASFRFVKLDLAASLRAVHTLKMHFGSTYAIGSKNPSQLFIVKSFFLGSYSGIFHFK